MSGLQIGVQRDLTPEEIAKEIGEAKNVSMIQQATDRAKKARADGYHKPLIIQFDDFVKMPLMAKHDTDGNQIGGAAIVTPLHLLEKRDFGPDTRRIIPTAWIIDHPAWPFRNYPKVDNEHAWNAILAGWYCLRCLNRHEEQHPKECASCMLSAEERAYALAKLEKAGMELAS